jgi:hypothetical protein
MRPQTLLKAWRGVGGVIALMGVCGCAPSSQDTKESVEENAVLKDAAYPDINTVPFGDVAYKSRDWHVLAEDLAHHQDKAALGEDGESLRAQGDALRAQAGLNPSNP